MSVKVRKRNGAWWVFIHHDGRRKAKKVGTREAASFVCTCTLASVKSGWMQSRAIR